jgi:hypothetical protein
VGDFVRLKYPVRVGLSQYKNQRGEVVRVLRRTPRARLTVTVAFTRELVSGFIARVTIVLKPSELELFTGSAH